MNLDEFIEDVKNIADLYSLKIEILARTKNAVKIKVPVTENIYISCITTKKAGLRTTF